MTSSLDRSIQYCYTKDEPVSVKDCARCKEDWCDEKRFARLTIELLNNLQQQFKEEKYCYE